MRRAVARVLDGGPVGPRIGHLLAERQEEVPGLRGQLGGQLVVAGISEVAFVGPFGGGGVGHVGHPNDSVSGPES